MLPPRKIPPRVQLDVCPTVGCDWLEWGVGEPSFCPWHEIRNERRWYILAGEYTQEDKDFVVWLEQTLIPDLQDSGTEETAKDFERCVEIIRRLGGDT